MSPRPAPLALLVAGALLAPARGAAGEDAPLTLADALRHAVAADEEIAVAGERVDEAAADRLDEVADLLPTAEVTASRTHVDEQREFDVGSDTVVVERQDYWRAQVDLGTRLLDLDDVADVVAASRERRAAQADLETTRHAVLYGVARAYVEALAAHAAVDAAAASAEQARALEEAARTRQAVGTEIALSVDRAHADRIAAEGSHEQARFAAEAADLTLAHAAGLPLAAYTLSDPGAPELPGGGSAAHLDLALAGRPDLRSARHAVLAARARRHAAALELAPDLDLEWSWRYTENVGFYQDPERWYLQLQASWSLPGIVDTPADIARARSRERQAQLAADRVQRDLALEVRSAELAVEAAEAAVGVASRRDEVAQANLDAGMRLYEEGMATGLEVATLKGDRDAAAAELIAARLRRDLARIDLLQVLGVDPLLAYAAE